jgi:hypothetical protein
MASILESDLEKYLVATVTRNGGVTRKVSWVGRRGAPDRLVLFPGGHLIWVELKAPGQKPTRQQAHEHAGLRIMGQDVRVVDSADAIDAIITDYA